MIRCVYRCTTTCVRFEVLIELLWCLIAKILQHRSRANLEMIIDRWSHEEEREVKRNQVLEERRAAKHLKEAPSVWVFGANHEGEEILPNYYW